MFTQILTVSALNRGVRETLQRNFPLLWVAGEISNLTRAASGHVYFSLKDETAQVRCVMFRNRAQLIPWQLENGQQVEAQALVSLFEARGEFQLNVEAVRHAGLGARYEAYARLRDKLEREGLFAAARKRTLPRFPRRVGLVTSAQAAALQDMLSAFARRTPHLPLALIATPVQGEGAAAKIVAAIELAGSAAVGTSLDVLILARGGGSIEDLWAYNEEVVARAIAACPIPVVSGVGHETDITIADLVADQRAATPTAAAELVSAGWVAAVQQLVLLRGGLGSALRNALETRMQRLDTLSHRLAHPGMRLRQHRQCLEHMATQMRGALGKALGHHGIALERLRSRLARQRPPLPALAARLALSRQELAAAWQASTSRRRAQLGELAAALTQLSPQATLERGYSIVRDSRGILVRDASQLHAGDAVDMHFASGRAQAQVTELG